MLEYASGNCVLARLTNEGQAVIWKRCRQSSARLVSKIERSACRKPIDQGSRKEDGSCCLREGGYVSAIIDSSAAS